MAFTTWRKEIDIALKERNESFDSVVCCTLSEEELDYQFNDGFGWPNGLPFTLWTREFVYFPVCYDGAEWVGSVSRHPDNKATEHFGGEHFGGW